jgi:hypothetical protein
MSLRRFRSTQAVLNQSRNGCSGPHRNGSLLNCKETLAHINRCTILLSGRGWSSPFKRPWADDSYWAHSHRWELFPSGGAHRGRYEEPAKLRGNRTLGCWELLVPRHRRLCVGRIERLDLSANGLGRAHGTSGVVAREETGLSLFRFSPAVRAPADLRHLEFGPRIALLR